ncbi:hypothetical protein GDO81_003996 [Engystomops pustulosus]|uniref:Uncharacterized protein n=1 Tax=Engystomops pustulosus TaxID=76066 RepID=A0AAV6ZUN0_ENGPU|nr:hypothetical protein GDO81_003996 [Engystomops pustulosus]
MEKGLRYQRHYFWSSKLLPPSERRFPASTTGKTLNPRIRRQSPGSCTQGSLSGLKGMYIVYLQTSDHLLYTCPWIIRDGLSWDV